MQRQEFPWRIFIKDRIYLHVKVEHKNIDTDTDVGNHIFFVYETTDVEIKKRFDNNPALRVYILTWIYNESFDISKL